MSDLIQTFIDEVASQESFYLQICRMINIEVDGLYTENGTRILFKENCNKSSEIVQLLGRDYALRFMKKYGKSRDIVLFMILRGFDIADVIWFIQRESCYECVLILLDNGYEEYVWKYLSNDILDKASPDIQAEIFSRKWQNYIYKDENLSNYDDKDLTKYVNQEYRILLLRSAMRYASAHNYAFIAQTITQREAEDVDFYHAALQMLPNIPCPDQVRRYFKSVFGTMSDSEYFLKYLNYWFEKDLFVFAKEFKYFYSYPNLCNGTICEKFDEWAQRKIDETYSNDDNVKCGVLMILRIISLGETCMNSFIDFCSQVMKEDVVSFFRMYDFLLKLESCGIQINRSVDVKYTMEVVFQAVSTCNNFEMAEIRMLEHYDEIEKTFFT